MDRFPIASVKPGGWRASWQRALALWLALLALTVQSLAPVAHARALQRFMAGPVGGYVIVCSADGVKLIDLDALSAADVGDGKAVGFHLPFDVHAKAGKHACCLAAGVPVIAPELPEMLPQVRVANATAPPRATGPQLPDGPPPQRPGHPRDPPALPLTASS